MWEGDSHATLTPSYNVVENGHQRDAYIRTISGMWSVPETFTHNPAPNPISIERKHLGSLRRNQYVVAEKSDGVRYLLLLTRDLHGRNVAVMADRTYRFWEVEVLASAAYFAPAGSLFDGELVWSSFGDAEAATKCYLAFDVVVSKGESFLQRNYVERISALHQAFASVNAAGSPGEGAEGVAARGFVVADQNPHELRLEPKPCFSTDNIEALWRQRESLKHQSDGLIFTPIHQPVSRGTHWSMFKWKEVHSIDFRLRAVRRHRDDVQDPRQHRVGAANGDRRGEEGVDGDSVFDTWDVALYGGADSAEQCVSDDFDFEFQGRRLRFRARETPLLGRVLADTAARGSEAVSYIAECVCRLGEGDVVDCEVIKVRSDKAAPNNRVTIARTLVSASENLAFEELARAVAR